MDQAVGQEKASELDGSRDQNNIDLSSVDETKPEANSSDNDGSTAKEEQEDESQYPSGIRLGLVILALCLAVFLLSLDNSIISTAIPKITDEFNSLGDIGWYGSGPYSIFRIPLFSIAHPALTTLQPRLTSVVSSSLPPDYRLPSTGLRKVLLFPAHQNRVPSRHLHLRDRQHPLRRGDILKNAHCRPCHRRRGRRGRLLGLTDHPGPLSTASPAPSLYRSDRRRLRYLKCRRSAAWRGFY